MPSALSVDLRERVIAAIETGTSRRQAAKRFGVGAASAIRWPDPFRQEGRIAPKLSGGDHGAPAIEAHADRILALCEAHPPIFLRELRDALAGHRAASAAASPYLTVPPRPPPSPRRCGPPAWPRPPSWTGPRTAPACGPMSGTPWFRC